jgi:hypothetical protein
MQFVCVCGELVELENDGMFVCPHCDHVFDFLDDNDYEESIVREAEKIIEIPETD